MLKIFCIDDNFDPSLFKKTVMQFFMKFDLLFRHLREMKHMHVDR